MKRIWVVLLAILSMNTVLLSGCQRRRWWQLLSAAIGPDAAADLEARHATDLARALRDRLRQLGAIVRLSHRTPAGAGGAWRRQW